MHWQGLDSGATYDFRSFYLAVCRLHDLIEERVWKKSTFFSHSNVSFQSRSLVKLFDRGKKIVLELWRQGNYDQPANAWDIVKDFHWHM